VKKCRRITSFLKQACIFLLHQLITGNISWSHKCGMVENHSHNTHGMLVAWESVHETYLCPMDLLRPLPWYIIFTIWWMVAVHALIWFDNIQLRVGIYNCSFLHSIFRGSVSRRTLWYTRSCFQTVSGSLKRKAWLDSESWSSKLLLLYWIALTLPSLLDHVRINKKACIISWICWGVFSWFGPHLTLANFWVTQ
jgi:hypothetical protein